LEHKVDFNRLSPCNFISSKNWLLDRPALLAEYAKLAQLSIIDIENLIQLNCNSLKTKWCLSQGHDTITILAHGLSQCIGKEQLKPKHVVKILSIAFLGELLRKSTIYKSLKKLEEKLPVSLFRTEV
jgi:hypothetical protein